MLSDARAFTYLLFLILFGMYSPCAAARIDIHATNIDTAIFVLFHDTRITRIV